MRIGVIGMGFVGSAVAAGLNYYFDVRCWDKYKQGYDKLEEVADTKFCFVCVPTLNRESGAQDRQAVVEACTNLSRLGYRGVVLIKSTVIPGTCRMLQGVYPDLKIVSNPEFLTAAKARMDFINPARIILGGDNEYTGWAADMYRDRFPGVKCFETTWEGAELVKYVGNVFFALKIAYLNEIREACDKVGVEYNDVKEMFLSDGRVGYSHADVPGTDGQYGFGGACFPKDTQAFLKWGMEQDLCLDTVAAALKVNARVRDGE